MRVLLMMFFSSFQMGFYFVTTGWIFEIGLCVNSINQSKSVKRLRGTFCITSNTVPCLLFHAHSAYYVQETEEIDTATQLNLAKLTKEPSATYQIHLWSQIGTEVNRPHHGDILLRSPPWFGIETKISSSVVLTQLQVDRYASEKSNKDET